MMSSLATSSPVSASTLAYLMRWPVFRLSWLNETFSDSDVAGYSATGQVTRERRRKPFQLARGAMTGGTPILMLDSRRMARLGSDIVTFPTGGFFQGGASIGLDLCSLYVLIRNDR